MLQLLLKQLAQSKTVFGHMTPGEVKGKAGHPDSHGMVLYGFIPGICHFVAACSRREPVPLAPLVSHAALGKEDDNIPRHVLYAVRWHAQPAFEGHQQ